MNIVIACTGHDKQPTFNILCPVKSRSQVKTRFVLLRSGHISFCIDGIVEPPVGHGRHSHACLERTIWIPEFHKCHIAAIAPSEACRTFGVDIALLLHPFCACKLVLGFQLSKPAVNGSGPLTGAVAGSASIHSHYDITLRCQIINAFHAPRIQYLLRVRTVILIHQQRILITC